MNKKTITLLFIILFIILVRIIAMFTLALTDTTEARYGHTAYIMATTNDWITPYFDVNVPFWGKPPFSFWMQALSYKIFGINDFSARFPSLIFTLLSMGLIFKYLKTFYNFITALWGSVIYLSFVLVFILSGAIITDPYLSFSITLSMISFIMVIKNQATYWKYLFFIGLAIGLLAKGPLALVLVGGALFIWLIFDLKNRFTELKKFPWLKGSLLTLILSLPWYIIAEIKSPGFLNYFIIGEHFKRFIDAGWSGDLYGTAHKKPKGMIWILWLGAIFPWVFVVLFAFIKNIRNTFSILKTNSELTYFIAWSLFTMIFFSSAGNILITYVLPSLASLAILIAIYLEKYDFNIQFKKYNLLYILALVTPVLGLIANIYLVSFPSKIKTQKYLIEYYESNKKENEPIYFIDDRTFSAEYYSKDKAIFVTDNEHDIRSKSNYINYDEFKKQFYNSTGTVYIAIPKNNAKTIVNNLNLDVKEIFSDRRFILFEKK